MHKINLKMFCFGFAVAVLGSAAWAEQWRGLEIAEEHECTEYDSDDYRYSPALEAEIIEQMGGYIYGPYTARISKIPIKRRLSILWPGRRHIRVACVLQMPPHGGPLLGICST